MNATPTPIDFWKWLRENAAKSLNRFGCIHPYEIRKMAMACFNLRTLPDLWAWQKKNQRRFTRTINQSLKPLGLRMKSSVNGSGYAHTEKIAA